MTDNIPKISAKEAERQQRKIQKFNKRENKLCCDLQKKIYDAGTKALKAFEAYKKLQNKHLEMINKLERICETHDVRLMEYVNPPVYMD